MSVQFVSVTRLGVGLRRFNRLGYAILAIVVALIIGSLSLLAIGKDPYQAFSTLFQGAFGSRDSMAATLVQATPLIFAGLAVGISFQAGVFNIGAGGQLAMGGLAAALIGGYTNLPGPIIIPLMILAGGLAGAVWGGIAGALKAYTGASEIITTLMLNYIAIEIIDYATTGPFKEAGLINETPPISTAAQFPVLISGTQLTIAFPLALIAVAVVWFLLSRTAFGFELRMVGRNPNVARASGISVGRVAILTLAVSGFFAGIGGAAEVGGVLWSMPQNFSQQAGFDAIAVALIGGNAPLGILLAALFLGAFQSGSALMEAEAGITGPFVVYLEAIMIVVIATPLALQWLFNRRRVRREAT